MLDINTFVARILNKNGEPIGAGFLAAEQLVITCAHVVCATNADRENTSIQLEFPLQKELGPWSATIEKCDVNKDVAILRIQEKLPFKTNIPLGSYSGTGSNSFLTFGFPAGLEGLVGRGEIIGKTTHNGESVLQLRSPEVTPGFSGAPIFDEVTQSVVGMVLAITPPDKYERLMTTAFAIPSETLCNICTEIQISGPLALEENHSLEALLSLRTAFIDWSIKSNSLLSIPNLNVILPISKAWLRLTAMGEQEKSESNLDLSQLNKTINNYREWYRLVESKYSWKSIEIEAAASRNRLLVVVGGPGAGKSTLLRRITWSWSLDGRLVLKVSLRTVAMKMKNGESFEEALFSIALDGFSNYNENLTNLLRKSNCLLADGLDEAGNERANIADSLRKWALADSSRQVIVTTRPIGYNSSWLPEWSHYELLPLDQECINDFEEKIFGILYEGDTDQARKRHQEFSEELKNSRIASIAARNPQLLGFLLSLFFNGRNLSGNRTQLFGSIVDDIRCHTRQDKIFLSQIDKPVAYRVLEYLGYLLLENPTISESDLEKQIGRSLGDQLGITSLQAEQKVDDTLFFWEERGLVERLLVRTFPCFYFYSRGISRIYGCKVFS